MATSGLLAIGATVIGGPGAGAAVGTIGSSGLLGQIETNWFGGASRDAARQLRVNWFVEAAKEGSVWAARVILAAPNNVGSNEAKQWQAGWSTVQSARPDVTAAAISAGGYWDTTDNATSDKMRALVQQELIALGQVTPGAIPSTQVGPPAVLAPLNKAIVSTVQTVGAGATNSLTQALGGGGFFTLPTNTGQIVLVAGILGLIAFELYHHHHKG